MAFDPTLANNLSQAFRSQVTVRLNTSQRDGFERLIQIVFGVKNLRNVQLWTRFGSQQRNILNSGLGQEELSNRTFLVDRFLVQQEPPFPVKRKCFRMPVSNEDARTFFLYLTDNYIREYATRILVEGLFTCIEYAADSSNPNEQVDIESGEFDDVLED